MHQGKLVFAQLMAYLPLSTFRRCVAAHQGDFKVQEFACLDQFFAMAFAQHAVQREHDTPLANLCRFGAAPHWHCSPPARQRAAGHQLDTTVYAFDATTIDLCLSVFPWAPSRSTKAAIKLHTLLDLRGSIPALIYITDGKVHEARTLDELVIQAGAFYLLDRGCLDFKHWFVIHQAGAFFVTRAKSRMKFKRRYSQPVDRLITNVICDQAGVLTVC
jgi:hypothetical protein